MKEIVNFENIYFIRDGREILRGIDWKIREDERWALIGLNGCGKSTLLGMIPAYTYPSMGKVEVFGYQFGRTNWKRIRTRIAYISSVMKDLMPSMYRSKVIDIVKSGLENTIGFYNEMSTEDERRAEMLINEFSLEKVSDKIFYNLSEGEQRRTLLARAFMNGPDLMVLDEPCAGLDLKGRELLLKNLNSYCGKDQKPLIYITHSLEELVPMISHVAIMKDGMIISKGKKTEVIKEENLKEIYGLDIELNWRYDRPWIVVRS
ncbi:MAG: ATP-binding cassette domain-containing protein [Tissierellia bacterium]|nr:ATP-binding cassette domain-containing protein [Tissierellia bacterium]